MVLREITHPMYLTQGLMGDMENRDADSAQALASILGLSGQGRYGAFVPQSMMPESYGCCFESVALS
jgi:hypothetical protein